MPECSNTAVEEGNVEHDESCGRRRFLKRLYTMAGMPDTANRLIDLRLELHPLNPGGPRILSGDGNPDLWALCPNITAEGRLDVVMKPRLNHPHYGRRDCGVVDILVVPA
ncbi:hypothetical protein FPV67DRAFT_1455601 [Lyophyllum atratum]|nr:hypothetical protein FPV67DRAFT_1455601 [Lyophyllum atratum]